MAKKIKKVLVTGAFNVLHPGHIRLLKFAKSCGDTLIVGVYADKLAGDNVDRKEEVRKEAIRSIDFVDECLLISDNLFKFIRVTKPDLIVKGKEFEARHNHEAEVVKSYGGTLIFSSGESEFSCSQSEDFAEKDYPLASQKVNNFMDRHGITRERLTEIVRSFSSKKICVLGDTIIDEYIDCFPLGMSQEEPTLVVSPQKTERFLGGAGIVASHASKMGAKVNFFSVVGKDQGQYFVKECLDNFKVDHCLLLDAARPTTLKQRFRSQGKSLLRVSTLSQRNISSNLQKTLISKFKKNAADFDLVIFSDFNYGALPQSTINEVIGIAKANNTFVAADSQSSSQFGDISRYVDADLITPTEREARLALQNNDDGLVILADKLMEKTRSKYIILKLNADGMLAQKSERLETTSHTEQIEALNRNPIDISGAGDSVLTIASLAMICGATLWEASLLGSIVASIQVGRTGNIPISDKEIIEALA